MPQPETIPAEFSSYSSSHSLHSYNNRNPETLRDSPSAESSTFHRKRSHSNEPNDERSNGVNILPHGSPAGSSNMGRANGTVGRSKARSSGGFLLESAVQQSRLSRALPPLSHKDQKDDKGKRGNNEPDLFIPKRRSTGRHDRLSVGGSPLASEIKRDLEAGSELGKDAVGNGGYDGPAANIAKTPRSSIGYDTDPAQIVNMALSLSEGRRRQATGLRLSSGDAGGRRNTHIGQITTTRNIRAGSGAGQHHNPQRHLSLATSPLASKFRRMEPQSSSTPVENIVTHRSHPNEPNDITLDGELAETFYDVSESTFARVQKAKSHFELVYEHRRLLSHLPPLRIPGQDITKKGTNNSSLAPGGRDYNPLQYVRNRKLRFREKTPIDTEAEGWNDVQQVRSWVDAVIAVQNQGPRNDPDECVRLPELDHLKVQEAEEGSEDENDSMEIDSPASSIRRRSEPITSKPRRPRSDWVTFPGDLIADAYWLEQGLNKTKIEDKDGNKLYPPFTQFNFSGWGNRASAHVIPAAQALTPPETAPEVKSNSVQPPSAVPDLPKFRASSTDGRPMNRGRRRGRIRGSSTGSPNSNSGSEVPRKLRKKVRSRSRSRSSTLEDPGAKPRSRGRKKSSKLEVNGLGLNNADFPDRDSSPLFGCDTDRRKQSASELTRNPSARGSRSQLAVDESQHSDLRGREKSKSTSRGGSHRRGESIRSILDWPSKARHSHEGERHPRTSIEDETTATSSPATVELPSAGFPSIAINLSPPPSRSPSPTKKTRINPFRDRSQRRQYNGISATDFADVHSGESPRNSIVDTGTSRPISLPGSRGTSPMTQKNNVAADDARPLTEKKRTSSTLSRNSDKASPLPAEPQARVRGMFKGGRIAELVGNEVSRVGDFIWKREPPGNRNRTSTSTASVITADGSDTDEDDDTSRSENILTRSATDGRGFSSIDSTASSSRLSPSLSRTAAGSAENVQYHNTNLPTFTSPFQRDRDLQNERDRVSLTRPQSTDHISRLAVDHRARSRSPRLDLLAPPKLDINRTSSPSPSIFNERRSTYGFGRNGNLAGTARSSQIFNTAPDDQPRDGLPVTGLSGLKSSQSDIGMSRDWNDSSRSLQATKDEPPVTRQEIARISALLLSSGAKAREIFRRAELPRDHVPKFLRDTIEPSMISLYKPKSLRVARKNEHVMAAKNLIAKLGSQSITFRNRLNAFSSETSPDLHTELQALDDMLENTLTPRVRTTADEAGELAMRLTTTSSLAIKGLNDLIDGAMRRRRRGPVRWLRRVGYVLIEWTVVGLMWAIWLVVMVVRVFTSSIRGSYNAVRWLLWM